MRTTLILFLGSVCVCGQSYLSSMTWEPRNIVTKSGIVAYYDPGNSNTVLLNGSMVAALSNRLDQVSGGTTNQTLFQTTAGQQPIYDTTNTIGGRTTIWFPATVLSGYRFLQAPFTFNQPEEILLSVFPVSWISAAFIFDGYDGTHRGSIYQTDVSPHVHFFAGSDISFGDLPVGSWAVVTTRFNGAQSSLALNTNAAVSGDAGTSNMSGLTLGARYDFVTFSSNIRVAQMILCSQTNSPAEANYLRWGMLKQASLY